MKNPYLNSNQKTSSRIDNKINDFTKDLPFIPENFNTAGFLKGALVGAGVGYILTNEKAQQAIFKAIIKASELFQTGVCELKERYEDAKAEIEASK